MHRTLNSRHVFAQLKSKVEVDLGSAKEALRAKAISSMQIEPTLARLVRLNFGLSRYFWTQRIAETFRWVWTSVWVGKFRLSESPSQKVKSPSVSICCYQLLYSIAPYVMK